MGLGDTEGLLDAVARGADLFDCVAPTRIARHGKALHPDGDFSMRRAEWARSDAPIDTDCSCPACARYSRGYIRHLFQTRELLGPRLLTLHNLHYTFDLMRRTREAIAVGRFDDLHRDVIARWSAGPRDSIGDDIGDGTGEPIGGGISGRGDHDRDAGH
jgi:queuine tRNA-ribosyltransferase